MREQLLLSEVNLKKEDLLIYLKNIQEGVEIVDKDGNVLFVNPAFFTLTGIDPEQRVGRNIFDVNPSGLIAKVLATGKPLTGALTSDPVKKKDVVANANPVFKDGQLLGVIFICYDISETIALSQRLKENEAIKELFFEKLGIAKYSFDDIVGSSDAIMKAIETARKVAVSDVPVLILGESGVGKELFAHAIHKYSTRCNNPLITVNCAAIPDNLLESEIFGYEKGAFTGATKRRIGLFELANQGTIFFDEIGDLDLRLQAKLLRVFQEQEIRRLGGTETIKVNARVLTATNQNIFQMIEEGKFRRDLFYRLNAVLLHIPPLRERKEDIPLLAEHFIEKFTKKGRKGNYNLSRDALWFLLEYKWPGNVRELENVIHHAILICKGNTITAEDLISKLPYTKEGRQNHDNDIKPLEQVEYDLILRAVKLFGASLEGKKKAADALGISIATLYNKLKKFNIQL